MPSDITIATVRDVYNILQQMWAVSASEEASVVAFEKVYEVQTGDLALSREELDAILDEMEEANVCMYRAIASTRSNDLTPAYHISGTLRRKRNMKRKRKTVVSYSCRVRTLTDLLSSIV